MRETVIEERRYRMRLAYHDWDDARSWTEWRTVSGRAEYRLNGLPLIVEQAMKSGIVLNTTPKRYIPQDRITAVEWEEVNDRGAAWSA